MAKMEKKMTETELLLTDEFVAYAQKVKEIFDRKKQNELDFKKLFDEFKDKQKKLDLETKTVHEKWEGWKKEQLTKKDA